MNVEQYDRADVLNKIKEISDKLDKENKNDDADSSKITKLMFEQLLRGMALQTFPMKNY